MAASNISVRWRRAISTSSATAQGGPRRGFDDASRPRVISARPTPDQVVGPLVDIAKNGVISPSARGPWR
jgi:hypothetical protein